MNPLQIKVYDFFDIQREICKLMNIKNEEFRDYHRVVGGEYKDLWHEWIRYIDPELRNNTIRSVYFQDTLERYIDKVIADDKSWLCQYIKVIDNIFSIYGDDNRCIYIQYSW